MDNGIQTKLATKTGISSSFISLLARGKRRPSWKTAKKLAAVTKTKPALWLEGTPAQIQEVLENLTVITHHEFRRGEQNRNG